MRKIYLYLVLICFISISGCIKISNVCLDAVGFSYDSFETRADRYAPTPLIKELMNPHRIRLIDSILLVINFDEDQLISVYNSNDGAFLGRFLSKGRGHNEIINTWDIGVCPAHKWVYFNDPNLRRLLIYNIEDIRSGQYSRIVPCTDVRFEASVDAITILPSKKMLSVPIDQLSKERFWLMDSIGSRQNTMVKYPKFANIKETNGLPTIFQSEYVVKDDGTKIAVFNRFTDLLEIYTIDGELISMKQGPDCFPPIFEIENSPNINVRRIEGKTKRSYYQPIERDGLLWVLYSGEFVGDQIQYDKICVFDWSGNPKAIYNMHTNLYSFDVDVERKLIYGLIEQNDFYTITTYPL